MSLAASSVNSFPCGSRLLLSRQTVAMLPTRADNCGHPDQEAHDEDGNNCYIISKGEQLHSSSIRLDRTCRLRLSSQDDAELSLTALFLARLTPPGKQVVVQYEC